MPSSIYCIAFPILEETLQLREHIGTAYRLLGEAEIDFRKPKLGLHVTVIPPFRAENAQLIALGLQMMCALHSQKKEKMVMEIGAEHFFENDDCFAVVFKTSINDLFKERVTEWRAGFGRMFSWVYPPESYFYNPHLTIAECSPQIQKDYRQRLRDVGWEAAMGKFSETTIPLAAPHVFEKGADGWKPVFF